MERTSVSVVIPTRNRHDLLLRAIESVLRQTVKAHEIVVVDDASDPPVETPSGDTTLIRHESPMGPGAARNAGARRATGDAIAFLDDDDWWMDTKLAHVSQVLERFPEGSVVFHQVAFAPPGSQIPSFHLVEQPVKRMLLARPPHPSGLTITADVFQQIEFDEEMPAAADLDFNIRLAQIAQVIEIDTVLAVHGSRPKGSTDVSIDRRIEGRLEMRRRFAAYFDDPDIERHHQLRLAHLFRRAGQRRKAMAGFSRLVLKNPLEAAPWKGLALTALPTHSRHTIR